MMADVIGITRYRDKYKPVKGYRQSLSGLPTGIQFSGHFADSR